MADYCTLADVKARLPESGLASSTDYDDSITGIVTAASRSIDRLIGVWDDFFYPSTSDGTYYFNGNGDVEIFVDPFVTITSVSISEDGGVSSSDYVALSSSDWYGYPDNTTPIMRLDMDYLNGAYSYWPRYRKSIKVVGIRGHSATPPADVKEACIMQSVRWFMRAKQAYQVVGGNPDTGGFTFDQLDTDIRRILWPYVAEYGVTK